MEFIVWFVVGALVGGAVGFARRKAAGGPIALHASVGVVGALMAGAVLLPLLGVGLQKHAGVAANWFTSGVGLVSVLEALIGAVLFYGFVAAMSIRRSRVQSQGA